MKSSNTHKDIENWAVLLGGGVSLLVICNVVLLVVVCLLISGCGTSRKVERMQERQMRAEIGMVEDEILSIRSSDFVDWTGQVGNDGEEM